MSRGGAAALVLAVLLAGPPVPAASQETPETAPVADADARRVTLDEAVEIALRNNPALTRAETDVQAARQDRLGAWGEFLPDFSLGYGFSNASTARLDPTQQSLTRTSYTLQLGATYEIFDGFRRFENLESSRRTVEAERARQRQSRYETILQVKRAWFDAVARRELVEVERDRVRRQEEQLEFVRQQVEVGRANRSDLLRSQVDLNNARLDLVNARNDARAATFALAREMGLREQVAPVAGASLAVDSLPHGRDELMRMAVRAGPRTTAAREAAEAAESRVGTARSTYLPSLTFRGGWAWQNDAFPPEDRSWSLSLQGSYPLFNGFQRETGVARARAEADAARARQREAVLAIRAEVDEAYSRMESARASLELARRTVELSREDLRVTRERFRLGLANILDLQSAQITLKQAQADLVRRRFDYQIGLSRLESLVGGELETVPRTSTGDGGPEETDAEREPDRSSGAAPDRELEPGPDGALEPGPDRSPGTAPAPRPGPGREGGPR